MPTILRIEGFRFYFFSNERQERPHVHVRKGEGKGKFWLRPVAFAASRNMRAKDVSRARDLVVDNQQEFEGKWYEHFGRETR